MKKPNLPHLRRLSKHGREYWYFVRRSRGQYIRLPDPTDAAFLVEYERALKGRSQPPRGDTFKALFASYRASERFTRLASRTRSDYDKALEWLESQIGQGRPRDLERRHVIRLMNANAHRVRFARQVVQTLSVVMEHAIDIGMVEHNRAKGVRLIPFRRERDQNRPWPKEAREAYEANASPRARLIYEIGIGTGQRIGDILSMKWEDVRDGAIHVKQGKTGAELVIPLTARLAAHLAAAPREGRYILAKNLVEPIGYETARQDVDKARRGTIVMEYTRHGWRYTCAAELAAAGCSDEEIAAITGHQALSMVKKYSGKARQVARAKSAQEKRE